LKRFHTADPRAIFHGIIKILLGAILIVPCGIGKIFAADTYSENVREYLEKTIAPVSAERCFSLGGEILWGSSALRLFYERRDFRPAWSTYTGPSPLADSLLQSIRSADQEGLTRGVYHLATIESLLTEMQQAESKKRPVDVQKAGELDLFLTDSFFMYGSNLWVGRVNPETTETNWFANKKSTDLAALLQTALDSNQISQTLQLLLPPHPQYRGLQRALAYYRSIAEKGGWPLIPFGKTLRKGDRDERVILLARELAITGDLNGQEPSVTHLYDDTVEQAVRSFQGRHGLDVDGIVGARTLAALRVPADDRIQQIEVNMERWRWVPHDLGKRYILVNIAGFTLKVVEGDKEILSMRVVVGKPYLMTPIFSSQITEIEFNPYWYVPASIAIKDILPKILNDPNYLRKEHIKVFPRGSEQAPEINPAGIDWSHVDSENFPFRLRQDPGPVNALGRIKFIFPNAYDVYLHDTPARELFEKPQRDFSHGCIRIEKPIELAEYLLKNAPQWSQEKILAAINDTSTRIVRLPEPNPIHVLYLTAWVDREGRINFCDDIYERDMIVAKTLNQKPPVP
jgi:murein L,D-transpeptidase YcbB/YkuD